MKSFLASLFSSQPPPQSREGLPFWIFWLLLCVILLLVTFIFLRDKDLRRRLNAFFFRTKIKFVKMRLQAKLRKEKREKEELLRTMGQKAWKENIFPEKGEKMREELNKLEREKENIKEALEEINSKIGTFTFNLEESKLEYEEKLKKLEEEKVPHKENLNEVKEKEKVLDLKMDQIQKAKKEAEKKINAAEKQIKNIDKNQSLPEEEKSLKKEDIEKDIKDAKQMKEQSNDDLHGLKDDEKEVQREREKIEEHINVLEKTRKKIEEEEKKQKHQFQKEIKEWESNRERLREKLRHVTVKKDPLFENLGRNLDKLRLEHDGLLIFYSQIDRANQRILELEEQINSL